jgi:hypothetical protein
MADEVAMDFISHIGERISLQYLYSSTFEGNGIVEFRLSVDAHNFNRSETYHVFAKTILKAIKDLERIFTEHDGKVIIQTFEGLDLLTIEPYGVRGYLLVKAYMRFETVFREFIASNQFQASIFLEPAKINEWIVEFEDLLER